MNLYIASHAHHIEGVSPEKSRQLIDTLYAHASKPKYTVAIEVCDLRPHTTYALLTVRKWTENSDLLLWDNTCVMHRSTGGSFAGKYVRDMRRATVHDGSIHAWGLNEPSSDRMGYP